MFRATGVHQRVNQGKFIDIKRGKGKQQNPPSWGRIINRRRELEQRRIAEASERIPPVDPTPEMARSLYRQMLKMGYATLVLTDKSYYRQKLRYEFEVTARMTSARVRGMMFEKGKWMLRNQLGGLQ
jgi:hypothetical protein